MKVFVNGSFDVLHVGHINLLNYARWLADGDGKGKLIVAIDEDEKIMADKGLQRPIWDVTTRGKAIMDLRVYNRPLVDQIEFFLTNNMLHNIIHREKPDVIVKGSDWRGKTVIGEDVARVAFYERRDDDYSTTSIIRQILTKHEVLR